MQGGAPTGTPYSDSQRLGQYKAGEGTRVGSALGLNFRAGRSATATSGDMTLVWTNSVSLDARSPDCAAWTLGTRYARPMADPGRIEASLTVVGDLVDPDEISRLLGADPDRSHRVGDLVSTRSTARRRTGAWIISTKGNVPGTAPLATHVSALLARVTSDPAIWRTLAERHSVRVFVGWFMTRENEGTMLDPSLLDELGRRGLSLDFDVYANGSAEGDQLTP